MYNFLFLMILSSGLCLGQITNGNFENWRNLPTTPQSQDPQGWTSNNPGIINHYGTNSVEKSTDANSGSFSMKINQFYDSTSSCQTNFLVYKQFIIDTSTYSDRCFGFLPNVATDYDTLNYNPIKVSFYYKTVNLKPSSSNYIEFNIIDTTNPFGLPSGQGFGTVQLSPSSIFIKKEMFFNTILYEGKFQLIHINIHIKNSYDSAFKNGYVLIDDMKFEGVASNNEIELKNEINLFPNPAQNNISLSSEKHKINNVTVTNVNGEIVNRIENPSEITKISIVNLPRGIYFLKIETKKGITNKKFVKN